MKKGSRAAAKPSSCLLYTSRYNLRIRRTLEAIEQGYTGDRTSEDFGKFEKYLKKVWFANGIHHHYSLDKFLPEFSESYFDELVAGTPAEYFPQDFTPSVADVYKRQPNSPLKQYNYGS